MSWGIWIWMSRPDLAQAVPGIHFILSGHVSNYERNPVRVKETQIFNAGSRGEYLGRVDFVIKNKKSQAQFQPVALTTDYPDHPQVMERIDQYKSNLRSYVQSLPQAGRQIGSAFSVLTERPPSFYSWEKALPSLPSDATPILVTDRPRQGVPNSGAGELNHPIPPV